MQYRDGKHASFVQAIIAKKKHRQHLVADFYAMADLLELYEYSNKFSEIEFSMIRYADRLRNRIDMHGGPYASEYAAQRAASILAYSRSDRQAVPYDSLGHLRKKMAEGEIPPILETRRDYPLKAGYEVESAFRRTITNRLIHEVDQLVDLAEYGMSDVFRCLIEAALLRAPLSFSEDRVLFAASRPGPYSQWRTGLGVMDIRAAFNLWSQAGS